MNRYLSRGEFHLRSVCRFGNILCVAYAERPIMFVRCILMSAIRESAEKDVSHVLTLKLPTCSSQCVYRTTEFQSGLRHRFFI